MSNLISRNKAIELKQTWYFTGKPCKRNHIDKRLISNRLCFECERIRTINYYNNNKEKVKNTKNKWIKSNIEKNLQIKKDYRIKNKEIIKIYSLEYQRKKLQNPTYKVSRRISKQIWDFLKNKGKKRKSWIDYVDYSGQDLKNHLESKFINTMSWDNYGTFWEIDHIKPISWFLKENNSNVNEIWSLSNLQPLECSLNRSKMNKNNYTRNQLIENKHE